MAAETEFIHVIILLILDHSLTDSSDIKSVSNLEMILILIVCNSIQQFNIFLAAFYTGTNYAFDWRLITHPKDYSGVVEGKHSRTQKLSKVPITAFTFC